MISIKHKISNELRSWYCGIMSEEINKKIANADTIENSSTDYKTDLKPDKKSSSDKKNQVIIFPEDQNLLSRLTMNLKQMDAEFLQILLAGSRKLLEDRYLWVKEYAILCDAVAYIMAEKKTKGTYPVEELNQFLMQDRNKQNPYLRKARENYHKEKAKKKKASDKEKMPQTMAVAMANDLPNTKTQFQVLAKEISRILAVINSIIEKYVDYEMMKSEVRQKLIHDMGISVCPYCNRTYITTFVYKDKKSNDITSGKDKEHYLVIADLDHFYLKSIYQLYSLSLWNFVPSCKPCNQRLKQDNPLRTLCPAEAGFDDDCYFTLDLPVNEEGLPSAAALLGFGSLSGHWKVRENSDKERQIRNSIELFQLDKQYEGYGKELSEILRKKYMQERFYQSLDEFLQKIADKTPESDRQAGAADVNWGRNSLYHLDENSRNRLIYGVSLDESKFADEPLSKMIYDVLHIKDKKKGSEFI